MSTNVPGSSEPEFLGPDSPAAGTTKPPRGGTGRRTGIIAAAAVAVVAAVGAGAYGVVQLMAGGSSPATAVPADALGYVSLDLDPSASQKIEAVKILRKFPGLKKELNVGSRDALRKAVFDEIVKSGDCQGIDYAKDVEPWIGERVAVAAVPDAEEGALPLFVLQVGDQDKARAGVRKLEKCGAAEDQEPDRTGVAFVGDYMLLAETQKEADSMAKDAEASTLADDDAFTSAMDRAGDPGIISMYASKDAPDAIGKAQSKGQAGMPGMSGSELDQLHTMFQDFDGAAGVVRFSDGAIEAEFTGKGLPSNIGAVDGDGGPDVATLPGTTAAAFSLAFRDGWLKDYLDTMNEVLGGGQSLDEMLGQAEQQTGLQLPEDLETLLGDGISVSVDAGADLKKLTESPDPTQVPAGIRIKGDSAKITAIIDKLKKAAGPDGDMVKVASGDGIVAVGLDPEYVDQLTKRGALGDVEAFSDVVPEADRATSVLYVNFDAGDGWAEELADLVSSGDAEVKQNIAPLDALGVSAWQDDDQVQHALLRLTTD
jgi:hypothetical protein